MPPWSFPLFSPGLYDLAAQGSSDFGNLSFGDAPRALRFHWGLAYSQQRLCNWILGTYEHPALPRTSIGMDDCFVFSLGRVIFGKLLSFAPVSAFLKWGKGILFSLP